MKKKQKGGLPQIRSHVSLSFRVSFSVVSCVGCCLLVLFFTCSLVESEELIDYKTTKSKKPVVDYNVWNTSRQEGVLERRPSSNENDS